MDKIEDLVGADFFENREHDYKLKLESNSEKVEKWAKMY